MASNCELNTPKPTQNTPNQERIRLLVRILPQQYIKAEKWDKLVEILTDYNFIKLKSGLHDNLYTAFPEVIMLHELIDDLHEASQRLPSNHHGRGAIIALVSALVNAAHAIKGDLRQLPSQLHARLLGTKDPIVLGVLASAAAKTNFMWLRAIKSSLVAPGDPQLCPLLGHTMGVRQVVVTNDGSRVVSASNDGTARVWDIANGKCLHILEGNESGIIYIALSLKGQLMTLTKDGILNVWNIDDGVCLRKDVLSKKKSCYRYNAFAVNERSLIVAGHVADIDYFLLVRDLETGIRNAILRGHKNNVRSLYTIKDTQLVVSLDLNRELRVWDIDELGTRDCIHMIAAEIEGIGESVYVRPDGLVAATIHNDDVLRVWDLKTGKCSHVLYCPRKMVNPSITLSNHGRYAVIADFGEVYICDLTTRTWINKQKFPSSGVDVIEFSPNDRLVVMALYGYDTLCVWDFNSSAHMRILTGHAKSIKDIAFTPDGQKMITASEDSTLRVWSIMENNHGE